MLAFSAILGSGCGRVSEAVSHLGITQVKARTGEDCIEAFETYQEALAGKDSEAVVQVFGKPQAIFEKHSGTVWMYTRWCVQFDSDERVIRLERDVAATGLGGVASSPSQALQSRPEVSDARAKSGAITRISNGGQTVDLNSLMPAGKITVVDFYADWCGPCRQIAPELERLVSENPDVMLVKVDIVKWGTPVTQQYDIHAVPNLRVFDRSRQPVGEPTHSLAGVRDLLDKAGR